jgi:hypothetical protein
VLAKHTGMQHRFLITLGALALAGEAQAAPAFLDGAVTDTSGYCISGAGQPMTTLQSKVGYVVDPIAQIPQLNDPVYVHAFATNTACAGDRMTVVDFVFYFPPGTTLATDAAPVKCVISGNVPATACFQLGQQQSDGGWRFGTQAGLDPGASFEVQVPVRFTQVLAGEQIRVKTTSDWSSTGVDSFVNVLAPFQPALPAGKRGDDLVLIGGSLAEPGTLPAAFSNDDGSFVVTNHAVDRGAGDFAAWSRAPGVKRLTGDFNGDGRMDIALVGGPGWRTIPTAMSNGDGRFTVSNAWHWDFGVWAETSNVTALTGDFDRDGDDDIALVGGAGWQSIRLARSRRDGTYDITNVSIPNFGAWASTPNVRPIAGDFNRDGMTDIALVGGAGWNTLPVAYSYGNGNFDVANPSAQTGFCGIVCSGVTMFAFDARQPNVKIVTGDFNRDGHTDIALVGGAGWTTIKLAMGRNDRSWSYAEVPLTDPSFASWATAPGVKVLAGDFNHDGGMDIALTGVAGWNTVPVATSVSYGGFNVSFTVTNRSVVMGGVGDFGAWASTPGVRAVVGDYNGDGYSDIALTGGAGWGSIPVALGVGSGMFAIINRGTNRFPRWAADGGATVVSGKLN